MVEIGNEKIAEDKIDELIEQLFDRANLRDKTEIKFEEFRVILRDYRDELGYASLNLQCQLTNLSYSYAITIPVCL